MRNLNLTVIGFLFAGLIAWSSSKHLSPDFRTQEYFNAATITLAGASVTNGTDGVIFAATVNGDTTPAATSTVGVLPYPARLDVRLVDGGSATTVALTCTSVTLIGTTAGGNLVTETVTGIDESESLTSNSFEDVQSVSFVGCNSYGASADASDVARIGVSDHVALDRPISSTADLISVCTRDIDASAQNWTCSNTGCAVRACSRSIDLGTCSGLTISDNNALRIRYRSTTSRTSETCP